MPAKAATESRSRERTNDHGINAANSLIGPSDVAAIQRARMLAAMVDEVAERGAANVTVAHVVARSGVSRRTFYELFADGEDCFLAAFDESLARASERVSRAWEPLADWRARVRAGLLALLQFLDAEPRTGRLLVVESLGMGSPVLERRTRVLARITAFVDEGRGEGKPGKEPSPVTAEGIVGGVLSVIHTRLRGPGHPALTGLTGPLMSLIVLPYLGPEAARQELERPVPESSEHIPSGSGDPLRDVDMRLTYRTVRVLLAVSVRPGASNRQVGEASGVGDQGQISKLLARLQNLGLIANTGGGQRRGSTNAWALTTKGLEVQSAIAPQTQRA